MINTKSNCLPKGGSFFYDFYQASPVRMEVTPPLPTFVPLM
jgi:hypothetical protein